MLAYYYIGFLGLLTGGMIYATRNSLPARQVLMVLLKPTFCLVAVIVLLLLADQYGIGFHVTTK